MTATDTSGLMDGKEFRESLINARFERANCRGSDRDYAATVLFCFVDERARLLWHVNPFFMHDVFFERICLHGTECPQSDVERDGRKADAL